MPAENPVVSAGDDNVKPDAVGSATGATWAFVSGALTVSVPKRAVIETLVPPGDHSTRKRRFVAGCDRNAPAMNAAIVSVVSAPDGVKFIAWPSSVTVYGVDAANDATVTAAVAGVDAPSAPENAVTGNAVPSLDVKVVLF